MVLSKLLLLAFIQAQPNTAHLNALLEEGLAEASARLNTPRCAQLFGNGANAKLRQAIYRFAPYGRPAYRAGGRLSIITAVTLREFNTVIINREGPFVDPSISVRNASSMFVTFNEGLSDLKFRALILLHELGHLTGNFKEDGADAERAAAYTEMVRSRCF